MASFSLILKLCRGGKVSIQIPFSIDMFIISVSFFIPFYGG